MFASASASASAPPAELWVRLMAYTPGAVNQAVLVSTQDCRLVTHFIKAIKKELSPKLDAVAVDDITLHATEDGPALEPDDPLPPTNTKQTALVVAVPAPAAPSSGPLMKAGRQKTLKKMSVEASCRKFLDAIALNLSYYYDFPRAHPRGPTIGDVLHAVSPPAQGEGPEWSFRRESKSYTRMDLDGFIIQVNRGDPLATVPLPEVFTPDEWTKLRRFNFKTTGRVHNASLPTLSDGRPYIILPHADYSPEMVEFLQTIGVKAHMLSDPGALVVKDEDTLSEGSSLC